LDDKSALYFVSKLASAKFIANPYSRSQIAPGACTYRLLGKGAILAEV
jgi:hypothetical protein